MLKLRTEKKLYRIPIVRDGAEAVFIVDPDTPEEARKRRERFTTKERAPGPLKAALGVTETVDWAKLTLDRINKVISDWEGIGDENGNPLPCTMETKFAVYQFNPGIINEVMEKADELSDEAVKGAEEALGNSGSSSKPKRAAA